MDVLMSRTLLADLCHLVSRMPGIDIIVIQFNIYIYTRAFKGLSLIAHQHQVALQLRWHIRWPSFQIISIGVKGGWKLEHRTDVLGKLPDDPSNLESWVLPCPAYLTNLDDSHPKVYLQQRNQSETVTEGTSDGAAVETSDCGEH